MNQRPDIKPRSRKSHWKQDPDAVKADILRIATEEFSTNGLSGARIDEIARRTEASKRMIYYYFGDKEGLYRHVLEAAYARLRNEEARLDLDTLDPVTALRRLVEFTFDSHRNTPEFIRLVMIENIHNAEYLKGSDRIPSLNSTAISKLTTLCERGKAAGLFRDDIDPVELHWTISALCFFNHSNRATFSAAFGPSLFTPKRQEVLRDHIVAMILSATLKDS